MPFQPQSITQLKQVTGLSYFELAKEVGCTTQTLLNLEKGKNDPSIRVLDNLNGFGQRINNELDFYTKPPFP